MIKKGSIGQIPTGSPWVTPFDPRVLGGLRGMINQFADSTGTILTPKHQPVRNITPFGYIQNL